MFGHEHFQYMMYIYTVTVKIYSVFFLGGGGGVVGACYLWKLTLIDPETRSHNHHRNQLQSPVTMCSENGAVNGLLSCGNGTW